MDRKKFLTAAGLTAVSITTFGFARKGTKGFEGDCETTNDILGPFYRENSPTRSDLVFDGLEGARIQLKGRVFKSDCTTPLKNAKVEIWHCDTNGDYDNDSAAYKHRGQVSSDAEGNYGFNTILPGKYLNGKLYRPAHIHYRVTEKNSKELISQLYFVGDPHITEDPWASTPNAARRILPIVLEDVNGALVVNFDIVLADKA